MDSSDKLRMVVAKEELDLLLSHSGQFVCQLDICISYIPLGRDTTNLCHGMVVMNLSHTLACDLAQR